MIGIEGRIRVCSHPAQGHEEGAAPYAIAPKNPQLPGQEPFRKDFSFYELRGLARTAWRKTLRKLIPGKDTQRISVRDQGITYGLEVARIIQIIICQPRKVTTPSLAEERIHVPNLAQIPGAIDHRDPIVIEGANRLIRIVVPDYDFKI